MDRDKIRSNELVRYSRAGDAFHYRWAARRCLKMLYPSSDITQIVIEGSKENKASGEYVIDIAEYHSTEAGEAVCYYQMKHTTVQKDKPFRLSDLKSTVEGFADRYRDLISEGNNKSSYYYIVTNRTFSTEFVKGIESVRTKSIKSGRFYNTITCYTKLDDKDLCDFCTRLKLVDDEG
ncbi:MAG: hypothetical protein AAGU75_12590, partial [Bacillota bacterium]